jgi:CRP-like cAMP-binding protein
MQVSKRFMMSEIPLFDSLTVGEMQETEKWLAFKRLQEGTVIYRQGTAGRSICFVVEGELAVVMRNDGGDARIASVEKGQSVGEMSVIDGMTRSADVIAVTDTSVLILKQDVFEKLCAEQPAIGMKILKSLARGISMNLRQRSESLARLMLA